LVPSVADGAGGTALVPSVAGGVGGTALVPSVAGCKKEAAAFATQKTSTEQNQAAMKKEPPPR